MRPTFSDSTYLRESARMSTINFTILQIRYKRVSANAKNGTLFKYKVKN